MKKAILMGFLLGMIFPCLVMAGGAQEKQGKAVKTITLLDAPYFYDKLDSEFEAKTGIKIERVSVPWESFHDKATVTFASKDPNIDLIYAWGLSAAEFGSAGYLEPMNKYLTKDWLDRLVPGALVSGTYNSVSYTLSPRLLSFKILWYNTDMCSKAGIDPKSSLDTWAEFVQVARKLTIDTNNDGKIDQYGTILALGEDWNFWQDTMVLLNGAGGKPFDSQGKPTFNTPEMKLTLTSIYQLLNDDKVLDPMSLEPGMSNPKTMELFVQGRVALIFWWPGMWAHAKNPDKSTIKGQVGCTVIPGLKLGGGSVEGSECYVINKYSKNIVAAVEYLKWVANEDIQKRMALETGFIPCWKSLLSDSQVFNSNPAFGVVEKQAQYPLDPYYKPFGMQAAGVLRRYGSMYLKKELSLDEALIKMQKEIEDIAASYK